MLVTGLLLLTLFTIGHRTNPWIKTTWVVLLTLFTATTVAHLF